MSCSKCLDASAVRILSVRKSGEVSEGEVENSGGESDFVQIDSAVVWQLQPTEEELRSLAEDRELVCFLPGLSCFVDFLGGIGTGRSGGDGGGELTK